MDNERAVRRLQARHQQEDALAWDDAMKLLLDNRAGRRMLWLFLAECKVFSNAFTGNALTSAFNSGEQNVGQRMLARILAVNPDGFLMMQKENADVERKRRTDADALARADSDADPDA